MSSFSEEVSIKLQLIRQSLAQTDAQAVHLSGTDWFAWVTAGADNSVLLTAETGVAEVLVTLEEAWIITSAIEAQRLKDEELPANFQLHVTSWADTNAPRKFICNVTGDGKILSDRPIANLEGSLPASLIQQKRIMLPSELERYRQVGRKASEAMTEVLKAAEPTWTEYQLAGAGAEALWSRGLHPALTLVAGERRLPLYRHPIPTGEQIGRMAMMVFCARGYGLYANLTRFVSFGTLSDESSKLHHQVQEIETVALELSKPGVALKEVYQGLLTTYKQKGFANAIYEHHQGGSTGYLAREVVANPCTSDALANNMVVAWNPSLAGAKIEDTFVIQEDGNLENLTFDANFPSINVQGRLRPIVWQR